MSKAAQIAPAKVIAKDNDEIGSIEALSSLYGWWANCLVETDRYRKQADEHTHLLNDRLFHTFASLQSNSGD